MSDDIDSLIVNMKSQFMEMRDHYDQQLQNIEAEFDRERAEIIENNKKEIDELFDEHKRIEVMYLGKRQQEEEENAKALEEVMSQDANKQAEQKIKLETEMQILEKCMEDMKAVYKLNQEKLGFNYEVLNERQQVYLKQKKGLRTKLQKDNQRLRDEMDLHRDQLAEAKIQNQNHTKEYKIFTNEFIKLQKRFEKFETADNKRIKDIWSMNDAEARELVHKIMHADKVIHLQQLSIPWQPPQEKFFAFLNESNAVAGTSGADSQGNSIINQNNSVIDSQGPEGAGRSGIDEDEKSVGTKNDANTSEKYHRMKEVFRFLINEAPYLIDDRAYELSQSADPKEALKIKIDSIRKSLDINDMQDVELLVKTLYGY